MRQKQSIFSLFLLSPSSRRAWIEMILGITGRRVQQVALLAEGVDRNNNPSPAPSQPAESPSSRRAWIEIPDAPRL